MRSRKIFLGITLALATAIVAIFISKPHKAEGCAGPGWELAFGFSVHPEFPLEHFAAGQLGVIQPQFARSYLVVAYRALTGHPLSLDEQRAAVSLWKRRMYHETDNNDTVWTALHNSVPGVDTLYGYSDRCDGGSGSPFFCYRSISNDAFRNAAATLRKLIGSFGIRSPIVHAWTANQDSVFANVLSYGDPNTLHLPRSDVNDKELQAYSKYQLASAYFYAEKYDEATRLFEQIASGPGSPYREIASLLVARSHIRNATVTGNTRDFALALTALQAVVANRENKYRAAAARLIQFVRAQTLSPVDRIKEVAPLLTEVSDSDRFANQLADYTIALDHALGENDLGADKKDKALINVNTSALDPMTRWILAVQDTSQSALNIALTEWNKTHSKLWAVCLSTKFHQTGKSVDIALATDDPAYETIAMNNLELLAARSKSNDIVAENNIVKEVDRLLAVSTISQSSKNQLRSLRMTLANSFDEFLSYAIRTPVGISSEEDIAVSDKTFDTTDLFRQRLHAAFDQDAANVFNYGLPLEQIEQSSHSSILPDYLRFDLTLSVWVRAFLLDRTDVASSAARTIAADAPSLAEIMNQYANESDAQKKKLDGIFILLKNPSFQPGISSGFGRWDRRGAWWWCADVLPTRTSPLYSWGDDPRANDSVLVIPPIFSKYQTTIKSETAALKQMGTAPTFLAKNAVELVRAFPDDERDPEILHRAVMATRYGCADSTSAKYSETAFKLLHSKYPNTPWAKKTKYYY